MGSLLALTDDILAEILIRVPSPSDLARASAAYASFRRVVSSPRFLRRFHLLHHPPPPLGVFFPDGPAFFPALPPNPSAPAARALAVAADFSFAFLPPPDRSWLVRDYRDGRFLLDRALAGSTCFTEVAVCDPLFRRYLLLPPIPDDLAASVENPYLQRGGADGGPQSRSNEIFLASRGNDEPSEELLFAVIWMACCRGKLVAFVFCSESRQWRALSPPVHHALSMRRVMGVRLGQRNHAHGCFYWMITLTRRWLVLDSRKMEFSILDISPVLLGRTMMFSNQITTLESGEGRTTVVVSDLFREDKRCVLYFYTFMSFSDRWQLQNKITLPEEWGYRFRGIIGAFEGCLFIKLDHPKENLGDAVEQNVTYFWFNVKTMQVVRFTEIDSVTVNEAYLYSGFPPSLSLPSV
ncbi:uncharacterized protein LOC100843518 [Brachypodium distachyon]|uniref:F-box domain-containing protein n=1 Tax=Brachypodium distachyon TaxID=15368 RepID=A0A0Q3KPZ5_BRADI|nr:uncharacterized protein LOC100843518 [Brachypodium distachyon]XP_024312191.1 uncharacterized protein LOC100843518 [Brachypodium distachyon]KQJ81997.1 hypothetical protein BRADI_5g04730v3 [Brachypodium distachyon]|eukprot:XP_003579347.2 uncharacterized protein LOC100843518 [Brachypodium distachyon]